MNRIHRNSRLIALPAYFLLTSAIVPERPYAIAGAVTNSASGKYIENVYIYITSGEEEALSNNKGAFTISTWQELPVTLVVEHPVYKKQKVRITNASQYQLIKLHPKHP